MAGDLYSTPMGERKRVLLVDDSATVAKHLSRILQESGRYEAVGHATNGLDAVKKYRELKPDLVCLDIVMPQVDGMETLRLLKQIDAGAKVVMVSSIGGVADVVQKALTAGAANVISKPFDEKKVLEVLDAL